MKYFLLAFLFVSSIANASNHLSEEGFMFANLSKDFLTFQLGEAYVEQIDPEVGHHHSLETLHKYCKADTACDLKIYVGLSNQGAPIAVGWLNADTGENEIVSQVPDQYFIKAKDHFIAVKS